MLIPTYTPFSRIYLFIYSSEMEFMLANYKKIFFNYFFIDPFYLRRDAESKTSIIGSSTTQAIS